MKTTILLRHATADRRLPGQEDFDRPLTPSGREEAQAIGRHMAQEGILPETILCSGALRAQQTLENLTLDEDGRQVQVLESLYSASPMSLMGRIMALPETTASVLVVGHNPTMEVAVGGLMDPSAAAATVNRLAGGIPPGGLAVLDFPVDRWSDITPASGQLRIFVTPRFLHQNPLG